MLKPWDSLRKPVKSLIGDGYFKTSLSGAGVAAHVRGHAVNLCIGQAGAPCQQGFHATDLRELAEFCTELADQLEGK